MKKILLHGLFIMAAAFTHAQTIEVKNAEELKQANKNARPGDTIVLQNGNWANVTIKLDCQGSKDRPIVFKAATAGQVLLTGNSTLQLGGKFIVVDGLHFTRGFAGDDAVIKFRINKEKLGNNCRVTNTVIDNYNNPKRMDDNYWVMLYGKNNRIDHCSFQNKKNMGVMMAVILDDERSRENFHSIDHNYFGFRLPLASNTGETIRVGVSEHCEFNSNTQIVDNFFEHCDGETEIISIKSGSNVIRNNLFKECQGSVVLRHGDNNTVENNVFMGNNKKGTGGVRVINKGQWVVNNLFYQCRGEWFRSPLAIMNGVPNSPANRYVGVTDAVIANNSFVDCTPIGLGIGSDTERSVAPKDVVFLNNLFYNRKDSAIYNSYDNITGIHFSGNLVSSRLKQPLATGFTRVNLKASGVEGVQIPYSTKPKKLVFSDSLLNASRLRLSQSFAAKPGFGTAATWQAIQKNASQNCGATWFANKPRQEHIVYKPVDVPDAETLTRLLNEAGDEGLLINLTGRQYEFAAPVLIKRHVEFTSTIDAPLAMIARFAGPLFQVQAGNNCTFNKLTLNLEQVNDFISTDNSGSCEHSNFKFSKAHFINLRGSFFNAARSSVADDIEVNKCTFSRFSGQLFNFTNETTNKGLYNVERLTITKCRFEDGTAQILAMLRGGNDESTLGPDLVFSNNIIVNCKTNNDDALVHLFGTQLTRLEYNIFTNSNTGKTAIQYTDLVKADHLFRHNVFTNSGKVDENKFVRSKRNVRK